MSGLRAVSNHLPAVSDRLLPAASEKKEVWVVQNSRTAFFNDDPSESMKDNQTEIVGVCDTLKRANLMAARAVLRELGERNDWDGDDESEDGGERGEEKRSWSARIRKMLKGEDEDLKPVNWYYERYYGSMGFDHSVISVEKFAVATEKEAKESPLKNKKKPETKRLAVKAARRSCGTDKVGASDKKKRKKEKKEDDESEEEEESCSNFSSSDSSSSEEEQEWEEEEEE